MLGINNKIKSNSLNKLTAFQKFMFLSLFVVATIVLYALILIILSYPITELSVNKAGHFGDSFGILTALFSGLAFSGMAITMLLQKEELGLQRIELQENRIEFKKSADAQQQIVLLNALTVLSTEYAKETLHNETLIRLENKRNHLSLNVDLLSDLQDKATHFHEKRQGIIKNIESVLKNAKTTLE